MTGGSAEGGGVRLVRRSPDFVERFAQMVIVSFPNDGSVFVLDFLKPALDIVADESGRVTSVRGEMELNARIILPPLVAKRLLRALGSMVRSYEEKFGEIRDVAGEQERGVEGGREGAA
ncbi:MAG: DUF3467 domain-containing protein [Desulfurococcales archaeon]|nr:DUF3467 domain-containing protein [Desulfurococcales archaeon]